MHSLPPLVHEAILGEALASAFERAECGVAVTDDDGNVIAANRPLASLLGYTLDELRALRVSDLSGRPDSPETSDVYRRLLQGEQVFELAILKRKDGTVGTIKYRGMNATVAGRLPVLVSITHEISTFAPLAA